MKAYFVLLISLFLSSFFYGQPANYGFGKEITILASQVSGDSPLNDFPVLISFIDPDLRLTPAGEVQDTNGYDIIFTTNGCFTITQLDHQIESYNAVTGEYVAWVKIPSLNDSVDTKIFMFYGDTSVTTDPSRTAVWTAPGYDGVWHLHDDFIDASGGGNNGTNNGSIDVSPANNSADGQNFTDPNHWIELPNHPNRTGSFSYSGWIRTNDRNRSGQRIICDDAVNGSGGHAISLGDPGAGRLRFYIRGLGGTSLDSPNLIANNTWHHVAATYNNVNGFKAIYVDGTLANSTTDVGTVNGAVGNASIGGEVATGESTNRFHGDLDEIRSFPGVLSPSWITTEYNNQSSPSTFYSVTSELTATLLCTTLPIELLSFEAHLNGNKADLKWITSSEINNDYFTIERSVDAENWEEILTVDGAGNSSQARVYSEVDDEPIEGLSYYRLKQTDFNGSFEYFNIVPVRFENINGDVGSISLFPNPINSNESVQLKFNNITTTSNLLIVLRDGRGREIYSKTILSVEDGKIINIPINSKFSKGIYSITAVAENKIYSDRLIVN